MLRYGERTVELDVTDDGPGPGAGVGPQAGLGAGHGLIGMRERVALYGGSLAAGSGPDGGFAVRVVLPADGAVPTDSGLAESGLAESGLAESGLAGLWPAVDDAALAADEAALAADGEAR